MDTKINTQPIIFLDIDGVLNSEIFYGERHLRFESGEISRDDENHSKNNICTKIISYLNLLCQQIDAVVVISSSWRSGETVESMQNTLNEVGATFKIISLTPYTGYERGTEISKWLKNNINKETHGCLYFDFRNYVIIDDDDDMLLKQQQHFFKVDSYIGLTPTICEEIRKFITGKTFFH